MLSPFRPAGAAASGRNRRLAALRFLEEVADPRAAQDRSHTGSTVASRAVAHLRDFCIADRRWLGKNKVRLRVSSAIHSANFGVKVSSFGAPRGSLRQL